MKQSPCNRDTVGRGLARPTQPSRPRLLDQLRQALRSRDGIRTIEELLGHKDVSTTMIQTHVSNKGGHGVRGPPDALSPVYTVCINPRGSSLKMQTRVDTKELRIRDEKTRQPRIQKQTARVCRFIQTV